MKKHIQKDYKRRLCVQRHEPQRAALKAAQNHFFFLIQNRFLALSQLSELKKNSSKVKVRNRCVLTGRSRGVYNFFKMARTMIRSLASKGLLPGVKKASW